MAIQESFIKLKGTVGDISFRKTKKGYTAFQKAKVNPNTLLNGKGSKHSRNLKQEFSRSVAYCKQLREVIRPVIQWCKDKTHMVRLNASILRAIREDIQMPEGERLFTEVGMFHLMGFDFNENSKLNTIVYEPLVTQLDFVTNKATLTIPEIVISEYFKLPEQANGFKFVICVAICDFANNTNRMVSAKSEMIDPNQAMLVETELSADLPADAKGYAITMLGVEFYRTINGFEEHLYDGGMDALQIVNVEANL